jgi:hypothetical protein
MPNHATSASDDGTVALVPDRRARNCVLSLRVLLRDDDGAELREFDRGSPEASGKASVTSSFTEVSDIPRLERAWFDALFIEEPSRLDPRRPYGSTCRMKCARGMRQQPRDTSLSP